MTEFIVALFAGASLGATFALISLGMVLAFRATHTFNFAHGEFMLIGALIVGSWTPVHSGHIALSILVALAVLALTGALFYGLVLQRTTGFVGTIATLGMAAALDAVIQLIWQGRDYSISFPGMPSSVVSIAGARVANADLVRTGFTLIVVAVVACTLRYTNVGRQVRLGGQNPLLASQGGVNVRAIHMASWAVAAVLAGVAGIAYGSQTLIDPSLSTLALAAAPAMVLGGLDSIPGAILGGVLIGLFQAFVAAYANPDLETVSTYALLLVTLLLLPNGILGTRTLTRV